jgi:nitroreductase
MPTVQEQIRLDKIADSAYEIFALVKQRYSPRTFRNQSISRIHLKQLFEAVRWSASFGNVQPWRFIYAENGTEEFDKMLGCLGIDTKTWAKKAPVLLMTIYKEKITDEKLHFQALYDLGLSLGGMSVQAEYLGIGLHHLADVDRMKARKHFDIPKGFQIASIIALGYYGGDLGSLPEKLQIEETAVRKRKPQTEFAFENSWPR